MADARARAAVQQCHDSLADLQRSCTAAKAFQEAREALLAAAADAVQALDALLAAATSDPARGRGLQQLAVRCQGALDQADALVRAHGCRGFFVTRLASRLLPAPTLAKFEDCGRELGNLAKRARHDAQASEQQGIAAGLSGLTISSGASSAEQQAAASAAAAAAAEQQHQQQQQGERQQLGAAAATSSAAGAAQDAAAQQQQQQEGPGPGPADATQQQQQQPAEAGSPGEQADDGEDSGGEDSGGEDSGGPSSKLLIPWADLTTLRVIHKGSQGEVWLGRWQETDVAIKQLGSLEALGLDSCVVQRDAGGAIQLDRRCRRALDRQLGLLQDMRHPNIVLFMGAVLEPPALVTEYCSRGTLAGLLAAARGSPGAARALDWSRRLAMALDLAKGMLYLHGHKPPIIHRDLKPAHCLVCADWQLRVAEFPLGRGAEPPPAAAPAAAAAGLRADPRWQAPEVIKSQHYSKASDVYAFGLILWQLLTWDEPFGGLAAAQVTAAVGEQRRRPPVPDAAAAAALPGGVFAGYEEYAALMQRCWAEAPEDRPTFERVAAELRSLAAALPEPEQAWGDA